MCGAAGERRRRSALPRGHRQPAAQLFPDRPDPGRAAVDITVCLIWWFINWVDDLVRPFIPVAYRPETYLPVKIPGLGLIIAFVR